MKKFHRSKKGFWRFITSVIVLVVIWQLVFFQCLTPLLYSKALAEDGAGDEKTISDTGGSSDEESEEAEEEEINETNENADTNDTEETISNDDTTETEETDNTNETSEIEDPAVTDSAELVTDPDAVLTSEPLTEDTASEQEEVDCDCAKFEEDTDESGDTDENNDDPCFKTCAEEKIENNNDAKVENTAVSETQTGENAIGENSIQPEANSSEENNNENDDEEDEDDNGCDDEPANTENNPCEGSECPQNTIDTGDAIASSDIVNDVNSNEIGTNFEDLVINITGEENGEINLYEKFVDLLENAEELNEEQKTALTALFIENINNAQVTNTATASADSGDNSISGGGTATIDTGDAAALANIVNLINRNLVGNNWLFSVINVLGIWNGDLVVPGEGLLTIPESSPALKTEVINENEADVSNNAEAEAQTGNNNVNDTFSATITTGQAQAASITTSIVNTNIIGNNWFFLLVNNMGSWIGNIFNWDGDKLSGIFQYDFGSMSDETLAGGILKVHNVNNAVVDNTASAYASSGGNSIENSGSANISTGNASALAKIFNFINTNVVGNNWMFAIVNIMGEWHGDLEFAYPDLAVSLSDGKDSAKAGENLVYNLTVKNNGKADCDNISIMASLDSKMKYLSDTSAVAPSAEGNSYAWNFSGLKRGEEKSFTIKAKIEKELTPGSYVLESAAGATTQTKEVELVNNASSDSTNVNVPYPEMLADFDSHLSIKREIDRSGPIRPGEYIKHTFYLENEGDAPLYDVILEDRMMDENGKDVTIYQWPIGEMEVGQKILVDYTLLANNIGYPTTFTYEAQAKGEDPYEDEVESRKVSSLLTILGFANAAQAYDLPAGEVLGAETANIPEQFVTIAEKTIPLWILLLALVTYFLAVNWSLVRKNQIRK